MSIPTDTAEFLEELNGGAFASQIGHAFFEVTAKCGRRCKDTSLDTSMHIGSGRLIMLF